MNNCRKTSWVSHARRYKYVTKRILFLNLWDWTLKPHILIFIGNTFIPFEKILSIFYLFLVIRTPRDDCRHLFRQPRGLVCVPPYLARGILFTLQIILLKSAQWRDFHATEIQDIPFVVLQLRSRRWTLKRWGFICNVHLFFRGVGDGV